ncbi:hypothetical protein RGR602_PC01423 (plasmid) [Rhizobium gallicum bv. gallicum R602sp]|uniref:Uncharacterized protein n=1 Tax=Rhizobium gallicum bv. gallicum R602sp TaxID=1041138 RepID=A0A0B4XBU4_9HYPH|nr:hypothetical protein RGR602_PC01423 [Rhizobium gallicum bv. gallicum R602sp]
MLWNLDTPAAARRTVGAFDGDIVSLHFLCLAFLANFSAAAITCGRIEDMANSRILVAGLVADETLARRRAGR